MNHMNFGGHGKKEFDENDAEIIELSSDSGDDAEQPCPPTPQQSQQQPQTQPSNYNRSMESATQSEFQIKSEIVHDSMHLNSMTHDQYHADSYQDDHGEADTNDGAIIEDHFSDPPEPYLSEESDDDDDYIDKLKAKHRYDEQTVQCANDQMGPRYLLDMARTSAPSPTMAASPAMVTSTTTAMTPAHTSTPSPLPNANFSTESQPNFGNCTSQNQANHAEIIPDLTKNLKFEELFKNTDAQAAQVMAQLIDSKVKHHMQEAMNQLMEQFDLVPKGSKIDADSKPLKQKRKHEHHYKLEKNAKDTADSSRYGREYRPTKKEKLTYSSSESSVDDVFWSSTSTPKYAAGKNGGGGGSGGNKKAVPPKTGDKNVKLQFRFSKESGWKAQSKPTYKGQKRQTDYGAVKNVDKSLYLTSAAAERCPLCDKKYIRMVSHFRNHHMKYEVFVSRLSAQVAHKLTQSALPVTRYARPTAGGGMPHMKMWCPFCECEKDFFAPYWSNHIRTHTGEYTNECIVCSKISLNASHCGQPTIKQKCNLNETGLSAYLCKRCNWVQIDEDRVVQHVRIQHGIIGNAYQNEYQKITIIPPLNQINPRNVLVQASTSQQPQRLPIATSHRPSTSVSSTGIQVLEDVVVHPPVSKSSAGANATGFDDSFYSTMNDIPMNAPFLDGLNIISDANQLLNDGSDDIQMIGEFPTGEESAANTIEMIKVDAIDDEALKNVFDGYKQADTNSFMVRPWMDGDYGLKLCIDEICQFALYKCMHEKCIFATNSMANWQIHMGAHVQVIDHFQKNDDLHKDRRDRLIKYRECSYCPFTAKADHQVLRHMEEDHRRSIFQCVMCYYRTIEMDNMVLHMQRFHPDTREVLLCGETLEFLQQDEEILFQDCENYVKKIQCDQDDCTEEYACYNSLFAHLVAVHPGTYRCPYCSQTMGVEEAMIVDHLKSCSFPEFQCLKCNDGFHDIRAIREHMSLAHPSNYLFVGARRTKQLCEDQDEIQVIYIGESQNTIPYLFIKCAQPAVLDGMDPKDLITDRQLNQLKKIRMENPIFRLPYNRQVPRIEKIPSEALRYSEYAELNVRQDKKSASLSVSYKCITNKLLNDMPTIVEFIDREKDMDRIDCTAVEFTGSFVSVLRHRFKKHTSSMVFLQTEQKLPFTVRKIVRCSFHCEWCINSSCVGQFSTRMELRRHFYSMHTNRWIAARISVKSQIIESNDPQQPIGGATESIDYFYCTVLRCSRSDCDFAGTRTQAIAHYNEEHCDGSAGSRIDGFEATMGEKIIAYNPNEIEPYLQELRSTHQMHLLECQHCWQLFDSLAAIAAHFEELRMQNIHIKRRFWMKRLNCCMEDNSIRTLAGMQRYGNQHPNRKSIVPVNTQLPTSFCGLCNYNFQKHGNLPAHFEQKHVSNGKWCRETYNDVFLNSLNLGEIDINQCQFATGCCKTGERNLLRQIVDHMLTCPRRFRCDDCPSQTFTNTGLFVAHCIQHDQNAESVFDDLHNFKAFLALHADMQIILPNGLVLVMNEISETAFGSRLQGQIGQLAQESWKHERSNNSLLALFSE